MTDSAARHGVGTCAVCGGWPRHLATLNPCRCTAVIEPSDSAARQVDDPVRRDREGWEAGVKAAIKRLQEDADEWTQELSEPLTPHEVGFITKRIAQIKTHITQIGELKYGK